jgi:hypothetical protein
MAGRGEDRERRKGRRLALVVSGSRTLLGCVGARRTVRNCSGSEVHVCRPEKAISL